MPRPWPSKHHAKQQLLHHSFLRNEILRDTSKFYHSIIVHHGTSDFVPGLCTNLDQPGKRHPPFDGQNEEMERFRGQPPGIRAVAWPAAKVSSAPTKALDGLAAGAAAKCRKGPGFFDVTMSP